MAGVWEVYSKWAPEESLDRAVKLAKEAIARDDGEAWGHWALGAAYLKLGQYDQAVAEYEKALELNPNDADVLAETSFLLASSWVGTLKYIDGGDDPLPFRATIQITGGQHFLR